ncbi:putative sulfoacetate transporter SauU [Aquisphaera giovannonii]|uniref:Putative sulfoacetate transporter SauU n=1 Tax=Aquisphaera giovannonii TaxID=406548 RepID=A0A5B9W4J2_9BACT|nr:MFS transporter [Aquisphaera giovannonii]QEH35147.1 putative sulfoacetate transporter SauU [Aquisphaera giovannonii]
MGDPFSSERPTSVRLGVLGFLAAMTFVLYLDRLCIGQAAPLIQKELGISDTWMGVVFAAFSLSYVVFEVPTGRWGDRFGSRGVLTRIVIWWSCFTALTGAASGLAMLLTIRFLFGAGEAGALPNSARVLKEWFPESTRGRAQGIITTAMMAGGAVAPRISQWLINALGWRWTFASFGLLGLTWAALFYAWFRDDPAEHPAVNDAERRLIAEGRARPADAAVVHAPIPWRRTLGNPNIWLLGVAMLTMSGIYTMLGSWYPKYLQSARGVTADDSSWLSSMVLGAGAAGCLLGGWLTDTLVRVTGNRRWGRTAQATAGAGLTAACLFLSLRTDSVFLSSVLVAAACFGVQVQVPAWWASATQVSGRHVGALFGLMNTVGNIGGILSPPFLGFFADVMKARGYSGRDQWDPGLLVYAVVAILGLVLWSLIDPTRGVDEAEAGEAA